MKGNNGKKPGTARGMLMGFARTYAGRLLEPNKEWDPMHIDEH
jgi:hypothetical protein